MFEFEHKFAIPVNSIPNLFDINLIIFVEKKKTFSNNIPIPKNFYFKITLGNKKTKKFLSQNNTFITVYFI